MLRKVSRCDDRKRSTIEGIPLDEEEAEGSSADSSHHGNDTSLATKVGSTVVVVVGGSRGAGGSTTDSTLDLGAGSVGLCRNVVAGGAVLGLDVALGVTAVLGSPLLELTAVALGPLFDVGDLLASLGLGPVLEIVAEVASKDGGFCDLGSGLLSGNEAGGGEDGDLGEKHCEGLFLVLGCKVKVVKVY